jgi:protein-tyrosine phosphatase
LTFDESTPLQKEWALAAACGLSDDIIAMHQADRMLRIDWLESPRLTQGKLGMTLCPGRRDRGRELGLDLDVLAEQRVARLLCLLTDEEIEWAGIANISELAASRGVSFRRHPIRDQGAPGVDDAQELVAWCLEACARGESVVVHCMGGLGRSGLIAACALVGQGASAEEAIAAVRAARGPRAIESREQERFVKKFAEAMAHA